MFRRNFIAELKTRLIYPLLISEKLKDPFFNLTIQCLSCIPELIYYKAGSRRYFKTSITYYIGVFTNRI